jgi:stage II sporulation protein Q
VKEMKDKVKRFLIDKKELLVFIAVVIVVFATVITIATLALSDIPANSDDPIVEPGDDDGNEDPSTGGNGDGDKDDKPNETPVIKKFALPVTGEYEVVRIFFDINLSDEELVSAVISNGSYMVESKGMSYAKSDNSVFDVSAIYDGTVVSVVDNELDGVTVMIKHSDSVVSIYSSLSDVVVAEGNTVTCGQVIAKASTSLADVEAGVHMHLQVKVNESYVNPASVFGKEMTEVASTK